jgi:O-antigen/teichoic acid export membrane protein
MEYFFHKYIDIIYKRIFNEGITPEVAKFLKNLRYIGVGSAIGALFSLIFQTQTGRILGPALYGEYTLVESVSTFLSIPMLVGITSGSIRCSAATSDKATQSSIISTTFSFFLTFCPPSIMFLLLFSQNLSKIFLVSIDIYYLAIFFAAFTTLFTIATDILRGLFQMKKLAVIRAIYPLCLLLGFIVAVELNFISINPAIFATYFALAITSAIILNSLRTYLSYRFISKPIANTLIKYGLYGTIGVTSSALAGSVDKILINHYLNTYDVGIYRAYYFASLGVTSIIISMFITVFFPTVSKLSDKKIILEKIKKISPYIFIFGLPSITFIEFIILKFYGENYEINYILLLLFSINSLIFIFYSLYAWFISSFGLSGARIIASMGFIVAILNVSINVLLIPNIGLLGPIIAACLTYILSLIYFNHKLKCGIEIS